MWDPGSVLLFTSPPSISNTKYLSFTSSSNIRDGSLARETKSSLNSFFPIFTANGSETKNVRLLTIPDPSHQRTMTMASSMKTKETPFETAHFIHMILATIIHSHSQYPFSAFSFSSGSSIYVAMCFLTIPIYLLRSCLLSPPSETTKICFDSRSWSSCHTLLHLFAAPLLLNCVVLLP